MNTLPNELLAIILNYQHPNIRVISYKIKFFYNIRNIVPVPICYVNNYNGEELPYYIRKISTLFYNNLPSTITYLKYLNNRMDLRELPAITHIELGHNYNYQLPKLPYSVTHIKFGHHFNQFLHNLPPALTHITFGYSFNKFISDNYFPLSLIYLNLSLTNNYKAYEFPSMVKYLILPNFDYKYHQMPRLCNFLTSIVFGNSFNQELEKNFLPSLLKRVNFNNEFNQPLQNLPQGLTHITFGDKFNQKVLHPKKIKMICPKGRSSSNIIFPDEGEYSVMLYRDRAKLIIPNNEPQKSILPESVIYLKFGKMFNQKLILPPRLKVVSFGAMFDQIIDDLPETLKRIEIFASLDNTEISTNVVINRLPVTHLIINTMIENLSLSLTHLKFADSFNSRIDNFPSSLTHITFGNNFNEIIENLPQGLIYCRFGDKFNQVLILPNLIYLFLGREFNWELIFPKSLRVLRISKKYLIPSYVRKVILL